MSGSDDDLGPEDKEHEPSEKRLADAREKGEVAKSADLTTAVAYAGFTLIALAFGADALARAGQAGAVLLDQADRLAPLMLTGEPAPHAGVLAAFLGPLAPFFVVPGLAALLALIVQQALIFAPEKLIPKLSRISPITMAGQKFGRDGLFEFFKSFVKLCVVSLVLTLFLISRADEIVATIQLSPALATHILVRLTGEFLIFMVLISLAIGGLDLFWQRAQHLRRNRMSRKEMMDEMKSTEGDPYVKMQRRQRGHDIAMNQMLGKVDTADVIVVNPEHYAVALKWSRGRSGAPVCVAKGVDEIAARIRERAAERGIPVHSDPPTARALYATVGIGEQIRPEQYRAVAAAIRFAEAMRVRARRAWR